MLTARTRPIERRERASILLPIRWLEITPQAALDGQCGHTSFGKPAIWGIWPPAIVLAGNWILGCATPGLTKGNCLVGGFGETNRE